ncbi:MAG: hypothetical protein ACE147_06380 [Candidatus Methylomirabilales bacterium]
MRASLVALAALALLAGCGHKAAVVAADPELRQERARSYILVLAAPRDLENAAQAEEAAALVAAEAARRWFNLVETAFILQASPGLASALRGMAADLLAGRAADPAVAQALWVRHGVGMVLLVDLRRAEQYWGRKAKATRVGLEARLVQLPEGRVLWQGRHDPELSGFPGHAVAAATRRAAEELVRRLTGGPQPLLPAAAVDRLAEWPVLEHVAPN